MFFVTLNPCVKVWIKETFVGHGLISLGIIGDLTINKEFLSTFSQNIYFLIHGIRT